MMGESGIQLISNYTDSSAEEDVDDEPESQGSNCIGPTQVPGGIRPPPGTRNSENESTSTHRKRNNGESDFSDDSEEDRFCPRQPKEPETFSTNVPMNADDDSSSSADNGGVSENTSDEEDEKEDGRSPRAKILLENPFDNTIKDNIVTPASVFNVPLMDRVKSESAVLERHVKLTPNSRQQLKINGKKICWNYRKGKCRFGHNCTFAHDSDIPQEGGSTSRKLDTLLQDKAIESEQKTQANQSSSCPDPDSESASLPSRKRPGLSQSLIPGKKVMANYRRNGDYKGNR